MENLFEKGCLVQLSTSMWGATRKIEPSQFTQSVPSQDWLSATKKLVDPEALKPTKKVVNAARSYLAGISLPFPIPGMAFVPKDLISDVDHKLEQYKANYFKTVEGIVGHYEQLRQSAMLCLGSLYNELDYPTDLKGRFSFTWRFVVLDVPNGSTAVLAPEVYEREKEKFIQTMEQARQLAVESLREEFAALIERISERFTTGPDGKPKVFKNATVKNFYEFFETFKQRNIFKDQQLSELVDRAQEILGGRSAESIRSDTELKERIRCGMSEVEQAMAEILSRSRRKIVFN